MLHVPTVPTTKRLFFVVMASFVVVTAFVGFAPTFYLRSSFSPKDELSILLHVHGLVMSTWITLFLVQTVLLARGSRILHQRLGWLAAGIATAMVVLVSAAVIEQMRRVPPTPPPPIALALSAFDIVAFVILVGSAILLRKRPEWHKRFMLSATIVLLGAPIFRIIQFTTNIDITKALILQFLVTDLFFVPCFAYDLLARHRIHPAYLYAFALILIEQAVQPLVISWAPWINFANGIRSFVA
jgi:hypothetical protein